MVGKTKKMSQVKQLFQLYKQGYKIKPIAKNLNISKNTVKSYLSKYRSSKLSLNALLEMEDHILEKLLHVGNPAYKDHRFEELKEHFEYYTKELKRVGVTRKLLWEEYRETHPSGYSLSQFNFHLSQHLLQKHPSLVLKHEPGEKLFVDFAGKKLSYIDRTTGKIVECQVFVACLPYSDYSFCMAVPSQKIEDFIYALTKCLESLGGAPKVLVLDNLKAAVIKAHRYEPDLNQVLEDFANHYHMAIVPARVRKPKDKALVENQVKLIYNRVYAHLRNTQFFSLEDLNKAIKDKVQKHNQTRMQNRDYCREEHFLSDEKNRLHALPGEAFEIKYYKEYKVAKNNHIYLGEDKHYYSVPYQHIGKQVKVVYTRSMVRIFRQCELVAVHKRDFLKGGYTTEKDHLCSAHQHYLNRTPEYYRKKALEQSEILFQLIELIISKETYPNFLSRRCDGLFSLQRKTPKEDFEKACQIAIDNKNYTYGFVKNIIENKMTETKEAAIEKALPKHRNIRGASYFSK